MDNKPPTIAIPVPSDKKLVKLSKLIPAPASCCFKLLETIVDITVSFTKTVISTIVSSSLKQQEAGAGMSLLNFTSFLSEGTGIAIVGGLLSIPLLDQRLLPMEVDQSTYLYSNLLLLFSGIIVISWLVTLNVYKHSQRD